jgi:hypothetical protein
LEKTQEQRGKAALPPSAFGTFAPQAGNLTYKDQQGVRRARMFAIYCGTLKALITLRDFSLFVQAPHKRRGPAIFRGSMPV